MCLAIGCQSERTITALFGDDVVAAPARAIELLVLDGLTCEAALTETHAALRQSEDVIATVTARYPLENAALPRQLPEGRPLAIEIAAYDASRLQIGRGCMDALPPAGGHRALVIELRALSTCSAQPTGLDITIVFDTSVDASIRDPGETRVGHVVEHFVRAGHYPEGTKWSLVTFGGGVEEVVGTSTRTSRIESAVAGLRGVHTGSPLLVDAIVRAAALARARSVCTHRPVLLVIAGGPDGGSSALRQEARVGLYAGVGDPTDDIYSVSLGLSPGAITELADLVEEGVGEVHDALSEPQLVNRLEHAAFVFGHLLDSTGD